MTELSIDNGAATGIGARLADIPAAAYLLVILFVGLSVTSPYFLTEANLVNVVLQAAVVLIISLGMTLIIITEGIDLSLGPVLGLAGVVFGSLLVAGWSFPVAMIAGILAAMAIGGLNGYLISYHSLQPFIVTLGTFGLSMSFAMSITGGESIANLPEGVRWFNDGHIFGLPFPIWATIGLFGLTYVLLKHTCFGRYVYAIGGNRKALALSGVRVNLWQTSIYVYAAGLAGFASFIMAARTNSAHPTVGVGLEFDAIAAAVLGGASFNGGKGSLFGAAAGALAVATLRNGLNLLDVAAEWQSAAVGVVIIAAVAGDAIRGRA